MFFKRRRYRIYFAVDNRDISGYSNKEINKKMLKRNPNRRNILKKR